jgi:acetylcholinesterase
LESGFAATASPPDDALRHQADWDFFVSGVPECAGSIENDTFGCLRNASLESIVQSGNATLANAVTFGELLVFLPVLDGPGGLFPSLPTGLYEQGHFAKIPVLAGQNTDEGEQDSSSLLYSVINHFRT